MNAAELETMRQQVRSAQEAFARDVDRILLRMRGYTAGLTPAIGEISQWDALEALQADTMKAFARAMERR